jgi:signal transduction histidine kinase
MAENIFRIFKTISREKQATFINEIHNEFVLYQYQEPIKIVLYNLILNALNFTEEGNITVSGGKSHKGILIKVKDEGQGMSEDQIKNVMSENIIVSSANVENRKGNGLGYLIIKDLLKLVDAKFIIKSKKGKGTMVTILLPVDR